MSERTLLIVKLLTSEFIKVVIPSLNDRLVSVRWSQIPKAIQDVLCPGKQLHAQVNANGAVLSFSEWEAK